MSGVPAKLTGGSVCERESCSSVRSRLDPGFKERNLAISCTGSGYLGGKRNGPAIRTHPAKRQRASCGDLPEMQPRVVLTCVHADRHANGKDPKVSRDICPDNLQPKVILTDIKTKGKDCSTQAKAESNVKICQPKVVLTDIKKCVKGSNKRDSLDFIASKISKTEENDYLCTMTGHRMNSCVVSLEDISANKNGKSIRNNSKKTERSSVAQPVDSNLEYMKPIKLENWGNGEFYGFTAIPKDVYEYYMALESSAPSNIEKYLLKDS